MNKFLLGSLSLATLMVTSSIVDARMLLGASEWSIRQVAADVPYCTLSRDYDTNVNFKLAKNKDGEGTIALDFRRIAFDLSRVYPIKLRIQDIERSYTLRPASQGLVIIRIGQDVPLFQALQQNRNLNIQIDNENFDIDLGDYQSAMQNLNACLGQEDSAVIPVKQIETRPVVPPMQVIEVEKDSEIDNLLAENRRLTEMLSNTPSEPMAPQISSPAAAVSPELIENLDASDRKLNKLKARLAEMERSKNQPRINTENIQQQLAAATAENANLKSQIKALRNTATATNISSDAMASIQAENAQLKLQMAQLEKDLIQSRQSINPNLDSVLQEKDRQIEQLKSQNELLKQQMATVNNATTEVVIKEIIREVPMISPDIAADDAEMVMRLAEAETQAKAFGAERDEYRRLLQNERRRLRDMGDVANQININDGAQVKLIEDVRRLEAERADLIRELEFAKSSMTAVPSTPENDSEIAALNNQVEAMQSELMKSQLEKDNLQKQLQIMDAEAALAERKLAELKVNQLADDRPEVIAEELELKTMRAEIAALEAQNKMIRLDVLQKVTQPPVTPPIVQQQAPQQQVATTAPAVSKPVQPSETRQDFRGRLSQNPTVSTPVQSATKNTATPQKPASVAAPAAPKQQMVALSGDEIRQLVSESRIPLKGSIDRIERVSGPDFAAFRWDTGFVYGSGEQSRMSNISAFEKSVQNYIEKTKSRCTGSFDETLTPITTSNNMRVMAADIACVDANANGNAASIIFFAQDNMFYALAHEADMDTFTVAMDMRDRMAQMLKN